MCEFYAPSVAKSCREPVAEEVADKERANFCDYFRARSGIHAAGRIAEADAARTKLEAMFGIDSGTDEPSSAVDAESLLERKRVKAEEARRQLDALFGDKDEPG